MSAGEIYRIRAGQISARAAAKSKSSPVFLELESLAEAYRRLADQVEGHRGGLLETFCEAAKSRARG
jgi:hypothetical protein